MKTLALILLACSAKVGWANDLSKVTTTYIILGGERIAENSFTQWTVAKGSETYTLDEFVKSGKFCEWRGKHEWILDHNINLYECHICHRERKIRIVHKDIEELEP